MAAVQLKQVRYRHEAIIDYMIANPALDQNEIAAALGITPPWLSTVVNSDAFRVRIAQRRSEYNEELHHKTARSLYEQAALATEVILTELQEPGCDPRFALDAKDRALHRLGYGPTKGGPSIQIGDNIVAQQNNAVARDVLNSARERIGKVLDGKVEEG